MKIEKIKKELIDCVRKVKWKKNWAGNQYLDKKKAIIEKVKRLGSLDINLHLPWVEINEFGDEEFYGFRGDFEQKRKRPKRICRKM